MKMLNISKKTDHFTYHFLFLALFYREISRVELRINCWIFGFTIEGKCDLSKNDFHD